MDAFNRWCRVATLIFLLMLGIEGVQFGHEVMTQARQIQSQGAVAESNPGSPGRDSLMAAIERK
ncbi:MAG: hypothetical protein LV479_06280 [Methylacidiphilales bacterium]|nr:hypothetical protein [Candidatus Methylacidiphilales bacterium]